MIYTVNGQNILMTDDLLNKELFDQHVTSQKTYQVYSDIDEPTPTSDKVKKPYKSLRIPKHRE